MKVARFTVNPFAENTYIIWDEKTKEGAIIDPGMSNDNEFNAIDKYIESNNINLTHLLITHLHLDHVIGCSYITEKYGLSPEGANGENILESNLSKQATYFGMNIEIAPITLKGNLNDNSVIKIGEEDIQVFTIPGHSPAGLAFYAPTSAFLIPGDIIFQQSIGRTDLPGGNYNSLIDGIKSKLLTLPENTEIYPGHGGSTTVGDEKRLNSFLQ